MAETYLAEAREGEFFVHVLIDIMDLRGEFRQIVVETTQRVCYRPEQG